MKRFSKKVEDFTCKNCGAWVKGTGYTNHCPKCLYSLHVDVNPGDRAEACGGLMEPIALEMDHGEQILVHQCQKCGFKKKNKTSPEDDFENILKLTRKVL